jgi:hypothetical protein
MNLDAIVDYACTKLGFADLTAREAAAKFADARWAMIWNHAIWRQSRTSATVAVTAGQQEVVMPAEIDLVHAIRIGPDRMLMPSLDIDALWLDPAGRDQPGHTAAFAVIGKNAEGRTRIRLQRPPDQATTLLVLGKLPAPRLLLGTDTPMGIPGAAECLLAFVMGDLEQWQRQFSKAERFFAEANALLLKSVEQETHQNAEIRRIIPTAQQLETEWGGNDFPGKW